MEIAIVGSACRLPGGVETPEQFWSVLNNKDGGGSERIDPQRWSDYTNRSGQAGAVAAVTNDRGYYLDDIYGFDTSFFNISKTEAKVMDPQQRIMLKVVWEAFERAGIVPSSLAGSNTGVYVGAGSDDYGRLMLEDLPGITPWTGIGAALCGIPNRISYSLDLHGPSVAFDTACSSSLAALTYATADLRAGRIDTAIVGGINIIGAPGLSRVLEVAGATSIDGTCKTFSDRADGYGRGEGAVALVLKRLTSAISDNDDVVAVIRESCLGQDGRTNGIMAPSGRAQADLFKRTCQTAGVDPSDVVYVEAHGTGTPAGDLEELNSISSVYGRAPGRPEPCVVGSSKTEIGHLEAAAGLVGVLKAALILSKNSIPAQRVTSGLNNNFEWEDSGVTIPTSSLEIDGLTGNGEKQPTIAVSSYGYGGTLGHVLMCAHKRTNQRSDAPKPTLGQTSEIPLRVSGSTAASLRNNAKQLSTFIQTSNLSPCALAEYNSTRSVFDHYAVTKSKDRSSLLSELGALAQNNSAFTSRRPAEKSSIAIVFSGQGSQWNGMLKQLARESASAREVFQALDPIYREELGRDLKSLVASDEELPTWVSQAALFAAQAAIWSDLQALGVRPALVFGHSVGEVAAAVAAGIISLQDGGRVICRRSRSISSLEGSGAMRMVRLPIDEAQAFVSDLGIGEVAVQLTSSACVVSLAKADTDEFERAARDRKIEIRRVDSEIPFHSSFVEAAAHQLEKSLCGISYSSPIVPFISTSGSSTTDHPADSGYWARNLRNVVDLRSAVTAARRQAIDFFVEVGGKPVLEAAIESTADFENAGARVEHVMSPVDSYEDSLRSTYRQILLAGIRLERTRIDHAPAFPTYQWDERPLRYAPSESEPSAFKSGAKRADTCQPVSLEPAHWGETLSRHTVNSSSDLYPGSHTVFGEEVIPAAYYLGQTIGSGATPDQASVVALSHIHFLKRAVPDDGTEITWLRSDGRTTCWYKTADQHWRDVDPCFTADVSYSRRRPDHADKGESGPGRLIDTNEADGTIEVLLSRSGVKGRAYSWSVAAAVFHSNQTMARVQLPESTWTESLLDAALTLAAASVVHEEDTGMLLLSSIERLVITPARATTVDLKITRNRHYRDAYDLVASSADGEVIAYFDEIRFESTARRQCKPELETIRIKGTYWENAEPTVLRSDYAVLIVADRRSDLRAQGESVRLLHCTPAELADSARLKGIDTIIFPVEDVTARRGTGHNWIDQRIEQEKLLLQQLRTVADLPLRRFPRVLIAVAHSNGHQTGDALARIANRELPDLPVTVVHCPGELPTVNALLACPLHEPVARLLGDAHWKVPRLKPIQDEAQAPRKLAGGSFVVVGSSGGIGKEVTKFLAEEGAEHIFALARSATTQGDFADVNAASVKPLRVDLNVPEDIRRVANLLREQDVEIDGVFHCAGQVVSRPMWQCTPDDIDYCCSPKVTSLSDLLNELPFSDDATMVLFSSCGYQLGIPGQTAYGVANAMLDDWSTVTNRDGGIEVRSIAWTSWKDTGVAKGADATRRLLATDGLSEIEPRLAIDALREVLTLEPGNYTVLGVETDGPSCNPIEQSQPVPNGSITPQGQPASYSDRTALSRAVRQIIAALVDEEADSISEDVSLDEIGMDSLMIMRLRGALADEFAVTAKASELVDSESIGQIVEMVLRLIETEHDTNEKGADG